jgi:hypothetical protein
VRTILIAVLLLFGAGHLAGAEEAGLPRAASEAVALASLIEAPGSAAMPGQSKHPEAIETAQSCSGTNHLCYWGDYYWCCPQFYSCGQKGMCVDMN